MISESRFRPYRFMSNLANAGLGDLTGLNQMIYSGSCIL
jgi:hypothetical protein